ncbi:hypothetical protein BDZ85DRAFT_248408 [Elsinoe ampelina]|uniref:RRM domain-containing protein n=1 Tax=Elsinoe ampelina TaxID=302913 RepID=A0A6A6GHM7_9PEZI|nr:hypothetical protein BDZ85DRAFT_248408 [Elsinoe ampelina]
MTKRGSRPSHPVTPETWILTILNLPRGRDWRILRDQCREVGAKIESQITLRDWYNPLTGYQQKTAWIGIVSYRDVSRTLHHFRTHPMDGVQLELCLWRIRKDGVSLMSTTMRFTNPAQISGMWQVYHQRPGSPGSAASVNSASPPVSPMTNGYAWTVPQLLPPAMSDRVLPAMAPNHYATTSHIMAGPSRDPRQTGLVSSVPMYAATQPYPTQFQSGQSSTFPSSHAHLGRYQVERRDVVITSLSDKTPTKDLDAKLRKTNCTSWRYARDRRTAFAQYSDFDAASAAIRKLNGATLGTRTINARLAKEGTPSDPSSSHISDANSVTASMASMQLSDTSSRANTVVTSPTSTNGSTMTGTSYPGSDVSRGKTPAIANGSHRKH